MSFIKLLDFLNTNFIEISQRISKVFIIVVKY